MKIQSLTIIISCVVSLNTLGCDFIKNLPEKIESSIAELSVYRADGEIDGRYTCDDTSLKISTTENSIRIFKFKTGACDETGFSLNFYTATIHFEDSDIVYYDLKGKRFIAPVECTKDEILFNIPESEAAWYNPWMPEKSQVRLSLKSSGLFYDWTSTLSTGDNFHVTAQF